jgi:hypothetical protein
VTLLNFTLRRPFDENNFLYAEASMTKIKALADDPNLDEYDSEKFVFGDNHWIDLTYGDIERLMRLGWL